MTVRFCTQLCGLLLMWPVTMAEVDHKFTVSDRHYFYSSETVSYSTAVERCKDLGFRLAFLETPSEAKEVHNKLSDLTSDNVNPYWIGLIRDTSFNWRWSSSLPSPGAFLTGRHMTFNLFEDGEQIQSEKDKAFVDENKWVTEKDSAEKAYLCEQQELATEKTTTDVKSTTQPTTTREATTVAKTTTQEKTTVAKTTTQETTTVAKTTTQATSTVKSTTAEPTTRTQTTTDEITTQPQTNTQEKTTQPQITTQKTTTQSHATTISSTAETTTAADKQLTSTQSESDTPGRDTLLHDKWTTPERTTTEKVTSAQQDSIYSVTSTADTTGTHAQSTIFPGNETRTAANWTDQLAGNITVSQNNSTDGLPEVVTRKRGVFIIEAILDDSFEKQSSPMFTESDSRPSAIAVGSAGVFIIIGVIAFIMLLDVSTIKRDVKMLKRNLNCAGEESDSDNEYDEKRMSKLPSVSNEVTGAAQIHADTLL